MSGCRHAVAVGFALFSMLQVILGQWQPPFQGEMNWVRRKREWKLLLNRPEFFERPEAAAFQLRFHTSILLFRPRICKHPLARATEFCAAVRHHFVLNEEMIGNLFDS